MKRTAFCFFITLILVSDIGCSSSEDEFPTSSAATEKPALSLVEENGARYLVDENGNIYSYLIAPRVATNFNDGFFIYPNIEYGPAEHYDGFKIVCAGHPRSGLNSMYFEIGPDGGNFDPPDSPYDRCAFKSFIIDRSGTLFESESTVLYYQE